MIGSSGEETHDIERVRYEDSQNLKRRLLSGIVLIGVLLVFTLFSDLTFLLLICIISGISSWEWSKIIRGSTFDFPLFTHIFIVVLSCIFFVLGFRAIGPLTLLFGIILLMSITPTGSGILFPLGVLYIGLPALSILWLKEDGSYGLFAVLFLFAVVIGTDTSSYILGRLLGGPKLAPKISPKKTLTGFFGGIIVPSLCSLFFIEVWKFPISLFFSTLILSFSSQLGDLSESILKRKFHIKDSSNIIPGHGGFLDRIDGLIFAAVVAGLIGLITNPNSPAVGLIFWSYPYE